MRWSNEQVNAYEARRMAASKSNPSPDATDEPESKLHSQIMEQCRMRGWLPIHGSMAKKATITTGAPDFVILMDSGNLLMVEAKTKSGKLSQEQMQFAAWAKRLGHTVHVVRSYQEFLNLL